MIRAALRSALSDRFADGKVVVLEGGFDFPEAKTKQAVALLDRLGLEGRVLVVVDREDEVAIKAFRNLQGPQLILAGELNAYDVLCNDWILFTEATVPLAPAAAEGDTPAVEAPAVDAPAAEAPADAPAAGQPPSDAPDTSEEQS